MKERARVLRWHNVVFDRCEVDDPVGVRALSTGHRGVEERPGRPVTASTFVVPSPVRRDALDHGRTTISGLAREREFSRRFGRYHPRRSSGWDSFGARRCFAMAERKPAKKATQQSAKRTTGKATSKGFTDEERAAMRERAQELKAAARRGPRAGKADGESDVLAKIAEMPEPDRAMAERLHALIKASTPALSPRTWYGMPAYAKDGKVVCFFQSAH